MRHLQVTRRATYVQGNTEAHSRNHCRRGKAGSIKYYECVSVFLPLLSGMQSEPFVICGLSGSGMYQLRPAVKKCVPVASQGV
jgi:hypothetical protein